MTVYANKTKVPVSKSEGEILSHIILPGGATIGQTLVPRLAGIYATWKCDPLEDVT